MELWELVARERIRDTLARYNWSGDAFRLDELAAAFCEDGVLEVRGREPFHGRAAIVDFLSGGAERGDDEARRAARLAEAKASGVRRIVRHLVTNTRMVEVTPDRARVESYFTVVTEIGLDHHGRYRDVLEPVGDEWLIRSRLVSTDWRDPRSTMARDADVS
ncbi:MAG TPA: nuclear transport factor 2 family protein [Microthrixaceae bacterium]|nr:nuclear transport factor 2 family protein [Microthrixaceae bacterium]